MDAEPAPQDLAFPFPEPPGPGAVKEVAPGILWLRIPLRMQPDHVNIYVLDDGDGWTVVDGGLHTKASVALWGTLLSGPLASKPVHRFILTHHHPDHVGMAGWFRARGAEMLGTQVAWLLARMLTLDVQETPTPETVAFWRSAGMPGDILDERCAQRPFNFADVVHPMAVGYTRIDEGDRLRFGGRTWTVRIGHGHAPSHATFWSEDDDIVITGDQVLPGISPNLGVYPTEPEADPVGDWLDACGRLKTFANHRQLALPGHKLPFTGLPTRLDQLIDNHQSALDRLHRHLSTPRTAHECFAPLYRREIGASEYGLALVEAVGHLNRLHRTGRAIRARGPGDAWVWRTNTG